MTMFSKKIIFLLFFIALASGFFWNQKMFGQPIGGDQILYDSVAQNLQQKAGIEPLYPLFLAGIYGVFGHNYDTVRVVQIILFALTVVFVYLIALKIIHQKTAVWAAVIVALFYGLANQAGNITTETLFTFFVVFFIYAISKYFHNCNYGSIWWLMVSGIALGLAALTRGIVQFLFVFIIINIIILYLCIMNAIARETHKFRFDKTAFRNTFFKAGVFLIGFLIVLIPWQIKMRSNNVLVAPRGGEILFARAELMENLYQNYPAHFIGHFFGYYFAQKIYPDVSSTLFRETPDTEQRVGNLLKEGKSYAEIDRILTAEAKNKIFGAPHKYVLMSVLDFISFNSPIIPRGSLWQNTLTIHTMFAEGRHPDISEWAKSAIILAIRSIWFLFLFLAAYGLIKGLKNPEIGWAKFGWIFLIIIYFNLAYSAIHAIPRYALPIYPFYVILAVIGITYFYNKYAEKQK